MSDESAFSLDVIKEDDTILQMVFNRSQYSSYRYDESLNDITGIDIKLSTKGNYFVFRTIYSNRAYISEWERLSDDLNGEVAFAFKQLSELQLKEILDSLDSKYSKFQTTSPVKYRLYFYATASSLTENEIVIDWESKSDWSQSTFTAFEELNNLKNHVCN